MTKQIFTRHSDQPFNPDKQTNQPELKLNISHKTQNTKFNLLTDPFCSMPAS